MNDQELIQWARDKWPNDENLIEAGDQQDTDDSFVYLFDVLLNEGERG